MIAVLSAELLKLSRRPAAWIIVGLWLVLNFTFAFLFPYLSYRTGTPTGPNGSGAPGQLLAEMLPANLVSNVLGGYPLFGGALVLILGALMTGGEYGFGTLKTLFIQGPRRISVLGGILAALTVLVLALGTASFTLSAGISSLIAAVESAPGTFPPAAVVGGTQAAVVLVCYVVGFIVAAGLLLTRRDVT